GVMAEEMSNLPEELNKKLSFILFDTMGIFWTMKYKNERQKELLKDWNLEPKNFDVKIFTPKGFYDLYKEKELPTDFGFSIKTKELDASDWCNTFSIELTSPIGILIEKSVKSLKEKDSYSIKDIINVIRKDTTSEQSVKNAAENRFLAADGWGLFEEHGTEIKEMVKPGQVAVIDLSLYTSVAGNWGIKALVVGIISRKLIEERITSRKYEELEDIRGQTSLTYISKNEEPLIWVLIDECLPYDSEIITSKAHTPIGEIVKRVEKGEKIDVFAYNEFTKKYGYYPIERVYKKGKRKIIKIISETGRELKCTPNHRILSKGGFVYSCLAQNMGIPAVQHYDKNKSSILARLFGHILGDGWLSINQSVGFSGKGDDSDLIKIKKDLDEIGFSSSNIYSRRTKSEVKNQKEDIYIIDGLSQSISSSRKAFRFFKDLGAPIGDKVMQRIEVPPWIINSTNKEKAEFLGALFGSDGQAPSVSNRVSCDFNAIRLFFSKSKELKKEAYLYANQIIRLLKDLGISANISERKGNIRKDGRKTVRYIITIDKNIDNTIKFLEKVGYRYCEKKEIKSNGWLSYLKFRTNIRDKRVSLKKEARRLHTKEMMGKSKIAKKLNVKEYEAREWIYYDKKVFLPRDLPGFEEWINIRYKNKTIFEDIISIEPLGKEDVFDISVKDVHNFISNGCIVHNCHELLPKEGKTPATDALVQLLREGRQPGISLVLATQQPGEIHKDVLTQSDIIISHRLTSKIDIEALNNMMQTYLLADIQRYMNELPDLKGSAIILDDNSERIYPIRIHPKRSWHGGESPSVLKARREIFKEF
ncbi:hypothetical protein HYX17_04075, partial [Candidatus Woesearchaeota archaeon]|nr:hypothetical protein [Candidatus Woesearchaeota archaeon]